MSDKSLKDKAMKIKGKDYVQVKDRILYLSGSGEKYSVVTDYKYYSENRMWVVKATLTLNDCTYTGLAQEVESDDYKQVNHTSALENCETSAVGRACAMAGIGVLDSIASVDEINKAENRQSAHASVKQIQWMRDEAMRATGLDPGPDVDEWIEKTVGMKPNMVPSRAVMGAINKIRDKQTETVERIHEVGGKDSVVTVTDKDLEDLKNGDLPY